MRKAAIIFKGLFILSCAYGLILTARDGAEFAIYLSYFTTQSNILCLVVMILFFTLALLGKQRLPRSLRVLKAMTTVSIMVTFLIYHFLLRPNMEPNMDNVAQGLGNILVHYVTPLWFFSDYLLFDWKGTSRWTDPFYYTIFPLYYFVFANVRAVNGDFFHYGSTISQFPYPFLDYLVFGNYGVSVVVLIISVAVLALGIVYIAIDHVMKKPKDRYYMHQYGAISHKPKD